MLRFFEMRFQLELKSFSDFAWKYTGGFLETIIVVFFRSIFDDIQSKNSIGSRYCYCSARKGIFGPG